MDISDSIVPRSDQTNAEDFLTGPRTVTIVEVKKGSAEQPVDIFLAEFPGRPFRPSKTVRRLLVAGWGPEASAYVGRRMTLYRDPSVRFGGADVGGIRVSHMSNLDKPLSVALTVSRGKRQPYTVKPLADTGAGDAGEGSPAPANRNRAGNRDGNDPAQSQERLWGALQAGLADWQRANDASREQVLLLVASVLDREVASTKELTVNDAHRVLDELKRA